MFSSRRPGDERFAVAASCSLGTGEMGDGTVAGVPGDEVIAAVTERWIATAHHSASGFYRPAERSGRA